jgi:hypothetical protein
MALRLSRLTDLQPATSGSPSSDGKPGLLIYVPAMTKAKAVIIPVTPFQQNCTMLWCEATKRAVVIDPGGDLPDIGKRATIA